MKRLFTIPLTIVTFLWKGLSFLRSALFNLILLAVIAMICFSFFQKQEIMVEDNSILTLKLSGDIVDQKSKIDPIEEFMGEFLGFSSPNPETLLQDILDVVAQADDDEQIEGILLDMSSMGTIGMDQLSRIGQSLVQFRQGGKPVIAAENYYNQNQYYLASHADKIFLNPMGGLHLSGFGIFRLYFKEAIEKLKINYHVFRVGSYKSALEPLTRSSMSSEDRYQSRTWLTALWDNYVADVSKQRGIESDVILDYINQVPSNLKNVGGDIARLALNSRLIDEIQPRHEIIKYLASLSAADSKHGFRQVSFSEYLKKTHRSYRYDGNDKDTIALIVAEGMIIPGQSAPGTVGADTIGAQLRRAASTASIKAVVLRINSGGGSAFASEQIRQEILQLKKSGKPVIVSMGTVAASGAYWISADADRIFASPNSLTGSIGIFMALPTFENSLNSVGIYRDGVGTTNLSGALDLTKPLAPEVKEAIQLTLEHGYRTFLSIVENGRGISADTVETIAQGRVFGGNEALTTGLVDQMGTLTDAIRSAADFAALDNYRVTTLSQPQTLGNRILSIIDSGSLFSSLENSLFESALKRFFATSTDFQRLLLFDDPNGMYAHCMVNYY